MVADRRSGPGGGSRGGPSRGGSGGRRGRPRYYARRKVCSFCVDHVDKIDYKDVEKLRRYTSQRFMINAKRKTGVCTKHQRFLATAIKRARHLAMLPFSPDHRTSAVGMAR